MASTFDREIAVLERLKASLTADGYEVILQPKKLLLPEFLKDVQPDAIALRDDGNLVIEVLSRSSQSSEKIRRFNELVSGQSGWTFRTVWTSGQTVPKALDPPSSTALKRVLANIDQLIESEQYDAALLLCWAFLEGYARNFMKGALDRPQTPGRLIEKLAEIGRLSRKDVISLRKMANSRNKLIHGDLNVQISNSEISEFREIIDSMYPKK